MQSIPTSSVFNGALTPYADESLNGFISRLTKNYVFEIPQHLLIALKVEAAGLSSIHNDSKLAFQLEAQLGLPSGDLDKRRYVPPRRSLSSIRYAGQEIRETAFAGRAPRIAPHTCKGIGYHRMCWDLEFVPADPDTGERLIAGCPSCKAPLRWNRPEFLICQYCDQPLATGAPSIVSEDVRIAAAIFSGLLSLDPEIVKDARSCLSPKLRRLPSKLLLQALYEMSSRPISERKGRGAVPVVLDWERGLVRMLQISIGWPDAILGLINELTAGGRRRQDKEATGFTYGRMRKVLPAWGPIPEIHGATLPVVQAIATGSAELFRPHDRFGTRHTLRSGSAVPNDAALPYEWFQIKSDRLRIAFPNMTADEVADDLEGLASPEMVKIRWGLGIDVISELTEAGYMRRVDASYCGIVDVDGPLYRVSEIEALFESLRDRYEAAPRNTRRIGFTMIASTIRSKIDMPHARLIRAIYDGTFRPIRIKEKARSGLECLQFSSDRAVEWVNEQMELRRQSVPAEAREKSK